MPSRSELISLLTDYDPADADEQRYRLAMLDLAAAASDPFDRTDYSPGHFTASAFVLHPEGDRILLIHHAKLGIWVQPGGHVDPDDATLIGAAAREVTEETGVARLEPILPGLVDVDIHVFAGHGDQPQHQHYDLRFAFIAGDDALAPTSEVGEAVWATPAALDALGVDVSVTRPAGKLIEEGG
jgi:8-oxo-dGTP pyrophosphatase MutT (NUDIX family)